MKNYPHIPVELITHSSLLSSSIQKKQKRNPGRVTAFFLKLRSNKSDKQPVAQQKNNYLTSCHQKKYNIGYQNQSDYGYQFTKADTVKINVTNIVPIFRRSSEQEKNKSKKIKQNNYCYDNKPKTREEGALIQQMNRYFSRIALNQKHKNNMGKIFKTQKKTIRANSVNFQSDHNLYFNLKVYGQKQKVIQKSFKDNFVDCQLGTTQGFQQLQSKEFPQTKDVITASCSRVLIKKSIQKKKIVDFKWIFGKFQDARGEDINQLRFLYYKDFLWKIAYSNNFVLQFVQKPKFYIGKGNNSKLLKNLMSRRWWWTLEKEQNHANFIWTQLKVFEIYKNQKKIKRQEIILKQKLLEKQETIILQKEKQKDNTAYILNKSKYLIWKKYINVQYTKQKKTQENFNLRKPLLKGIKKLNISSTQKITNHLQFSRYIGNKKALFYTMKQYYDLLNEDYRTYLPLTYHITQGLEDEEYFNFLQIYHEKKKNNQKNIWIVKPGQMSNRGNGIKIFDNLEQIKKMLKNKQRHDNGTLKTYIIQQYISNPFLYKGRKFDIRHYMMITCINGIIKGYWYKQGYIRTTSYQYNLNQLGSLIHLTNDAVQKYSKDYGKYEKGNKISYLQFQAYLDQKYGVNSHKFQQNIIQKMKIVAQNVIRAAYVTIDPNRRQHNFQIFGMDFMIDNNFKPWLIQINTNPCLQLSCPLLSKIIPSMVENALRIGLDPIYPPPNFSHKKVIYQQNKFELVFDQLQNGLEIQNLYRNQKKMHEIFQQIGQEDQAYQDEQSDNEN